MPREFLPQGHKRERRENAERFPRTETRVVAGPCRDRMLRRQDVFDRRLVKRELRQLAAQASVAYPATTE